jgi:lysophospholipase L1-like esterase
MNSTFRTVVRRRSALFVPGLFLAFLVTGHASDLGNMVVIGDSLSAGMQNGLLRGCQQLRGYASVVAKQAAAAGAASVQLNGSALILPLIKDPGFGPSLPPGMQPGFRVDPLMQATDLAVPGQTVGQALTMVPNFGNQTGFPFYPPEAPQDGVQMMTNLVLGFPAAFAMPPIAMSQVQWANALQPQTVIVWLGSNDVLGVFEGVQTGITGPVTFARNLDQVLSSLAASNRKIVLANIPDVTLLPFMVPVLKGNPSLSLQLKLTVASYDVIIEGLALKYNAPVVDIYSLVNGLAENGIRVNDVTLTTQMNGGLFSLDGIHPTDVGYAIIANAFISTINRRFGTKIQPVDLAAVAATDLLFPPYFQQHGPTLCTTN